jgi:hypothetical protein
MVLEDRTTRSEDSGTVGEGERGGRWERGEGVYDNGKHCEKARISDKGGIN